MAGATSSLISFSGEIVEVMMTIIMIPIDNNNNNNKGRVYMSQPFFVIQNEVREEEQG